MSKKINWKKKRKGIKNENVREFMRMRYLNIKKITK